MKRGCIIAQLVETGSFYYSYGYWYGKIEEAKIFEEGSEEEMFIIIQNSPKGIYEIKTVVMSGKEYSNYSHLNQTV